MLNSEMIFHIKSLSRFIYYVTDEEDRTIKDLNRALKANEERTFIFNAALGLVQLHMLIKDWETRDHKQNDQCMDIHRALIQVYKSDPLNSQEFYVFTDPEIHLENPLVQRRLLNIAHQLHNNEHVVKVLIFIGHRVAIPPKLQRYFEVIKDPGLSGGEIVDIVDSVGGKLKIKDRPNNIEKVFSGLTSYEIEASMAQSVVATKKDKVRGRRIDPKIVGDYKRRQLRKTSLIQYVDVSNYTFDKVGGLDRFKAWAEETKACWTEEGQKFGLKPPKGVLMVGVWGCGKSLSSKALAATWRLPLVQLEMGKLRSSAVGGTEANIYRALDMVEQVAPCVVWLDEAEKSLSGTHSSSQTDSGTTSRAVGIFSTWIQETKAQVCLVMTANSLSTLPVEFVNRMNERFFFHLPSDEERIEILKIHLQAQGQDPAKFQLAELAEASKTMVGREIEQAIESAMRHSFHLNLDSLGHEVLKKELETKPRIFKTMTDELKEVLDWVGYDPDTKDGIRAKFASSSRIEEEGFHLVEG